MDKIIKLIARRARENKDTMLVAVTGNTGSAPRGAGALMAVGPDGRLEGTIGGGALEYNSIKEAQKLLVEKKNSFNEYRLSKDEAAGLGMVCGGNVDVLYAYLPCDANTRNTLNCITEYLSAHRQGWLMLPHDGGIGFYSEEDGAIGINNPPAAEEITQIKAATLNTRENSYYVQKISRSTHVFVFGGGHLGQEIVRLLAHLGFRCTVTDDRPEYSTNELFPDAEEIFTLNYTELDGKFDITQNDCVIAVTRGHIGDYEVQKFALKTPASYIGVVGSKSKTAYVNEKLRADGYGDADIARITTPIGLPIKSETPAEIAVSIAAQLIKHRAETN